MSRQAPGTFTTGPGRLLLALSLSAVLALAVPGGAAQSSPLPDKGHRQAHSQLTVMTRNLYLGSSLAPATGIDPSDPNAAAKFVAAVAQIYATAVFTDFRTRAAAVAAEVAATQPDLIGLQEVSKWSVSGVGNPAATSPSTDFLATLLAALRAKGLRYSVAGVSHNAEIGPVPLVAPGGGCVTVAPVPDCLLTFADRDVILVSQRTKGLTTGRATSGRYVAQQVLATPAGPESFDRGWVSVPVRYRGTTLRMVNTHLEVEDYPAVQEAQASELLAGPAAGSRVILTGDFNSAADGSQTNSYAQLTAPGAFTDAWRATRRSAGPSCCQSATLTNTTSALATRIDLVLSHGKAIRPVAARLVGTRPFRAQTLQPRPIWASDHAGVVATLRIR